MGSDVDPVELAARALQHRDRSRREVDERLAKARAAALAARGYGDEWIRHDLGRHGVEGETAETAIAELASERERAAAVIERLGPGPKTAAHLGRKGFGEDALELAVAATEG